MPDRAANRQLAGREIEREALRLFPRLLRDKGYFALPGVSDISAAGDCIGMFTQRNGYRRPVASLSKTVIDAFCRSDWLDARGDRWTVSDAGAAWLRRQQAGSEPFRAQHQLRATQVQDMNGVRRPVLINEAESPLGWLRRRKGRDGRPLIGADQFAAGERLRADFTRARLTPRVTASWDALASSRRSRRSAPDSHSVLSDTAVAAKQRVEYALAAVGPELAGILVDVCCLLRGLEDAEMAQGWPRRSGKVILQIALSCLARHYGFGEKRSGSRLTHWGSADFRPTLENWR